MNRNNKNKIYCFIDTIEAWKHLNKKYKDYRKIIYSSSPEVLFNNNINVEKIALDEINISIIKPLSNDLGELSLKVFKKIKNLGLSHNFAIQYINFIFSFSNLLRFSTILDKNFFKNKILIVKSNFDNFDITETINLRIEKILKKNKKLKIEQINISDRKFQQIFTSPNLISRLFMNGAKNFEFLFWRNIWKFFPQKLTRGTIILGLDGPFLRETSVYLSRHGYKFKIIPKFKINKTVEIDKKILKNIDFINKDVKKVFKKYLKNNVFSITYNVFLDELFLFLKKYQFNIKYWNNYFEKNFKKNKPKCLLSTHLADRSFIGITDYLEKNNIPIFNFQHGHSREIRYQPEFEKWGTIFEPLANITFVYNDKSKNKSLSVNKLARGRYVTSGVPSIYKKNTILFHKPKHKIIFLSSSFFIGIVRSQIPTAMWSDKKRFELELNLINKVFKKIPHNLLYKIYPLQGNLTESVIRKEISSCENISLVKKNFDLNYFLYSKRIIVTYGASSHLGWSIFSKLPLVFIDTPDRPLEKSFKCKIKKSIFLFNYGEKNFFENLNNFLSQPLSNIYALWEKKKKYRDSLFKYLSSDNKDYAGKVAAKYILDMC